MTPESLFLVLILHLIDFPFRHQLPEGRDQCRKSVVEHSVVGASPILFVCVVVFVDDDE